MVLSAFASVAIYRAIHLETNEYQKILMSKVTKEENLADPNTTIKMIWYDAIVQLKYFDYDILYYVQVDAKKIVGSLHEQYSSIKCR